MNSDNYKEWLTSKRDEPIGSKKRMAYDFSVLNFSEYLERYYSKFPNLDWELGLDWLRWYEDFIKPAFGEDEMLKNRSGYYGGERFFNELEEKYEGFYNQLGYDEQLQKILAFMDVDRFFVHYKITFLEWLEHENFMHPLIGQKTYSGHEKTVRELLEIDFGQNYLKYRLRSLSWWNFSRDPQGG